MQAFHLSHPPQMCFPPIWSKYLLLDVLIQKTLRLSSNQKKIPFKWPPGRKWQMLSAWKSLCTFLVCLSEQFIGNSSVRLWFSKWCSIAPNTMQASQKFLASFTSPKNVNKSYERNFRSNFGHLNTDRIMIDIIEIMTVFLRCQHNNITEQEIVLSLRRCSLKQLALQYYTLCTLLSKGLTE